jgi:hypothetical protein
MSRFYFGRGISNKPLVQCCAVMERLFLFVSIFKNETPETWETLRRGGHNYNKFLDQVFRLAAEKPSGNDGGTWKTLNDAYDRAIHIITLHLGERIDSNMDFSKDSLLNMFDSVDFSEERIQEATRQYDNSNLSNFLKKVTRSASALAMFTYGQVGEDAPNQILFSPLPLQWSQYFQKIVEKQPNQGDMAAPVTVPSALTTSTAAETSSRAAAPATAAPAAVSEEEKAPKKKAAAAGKSAAIKRAVAAPAAAADKEDDEDVFKRITSQMLDDVGSDQKK